MKRGLALVDGRSALNVLERLGDFADEVVPFMTDGVTYESVSCHPDIFVYQDEMGLVVAPNSPRALFDALNRHSVCFEIGTSLVGSLLENSCYYNCVATKNSFFAKCGFADVCVTDRNLQKRFVNLPQSYVRCSMLSLPDEAVITSDRGIEKCVRKEGYECFYFSPEDIRIKVHKYGFLGGTCGMLHEDIIVFNGNPLRHDSGRGLYDFLEKHEVRPVALADDYLYDGGGLFFI